MKDLNDYFYFVQIVDHGGFAAAGRALNQPKSKLSKRMSALEERLGVRLLERTSRRFSVTEVGEAFYERCKAMLGEADAAEEVAAFVQGEPSGMVRVSCPEGIMGRALHELLPAYLVRYPRVKIQVYATDRKIDLVDEKIDLALRVSTEMESEAALTIRVLSKVRRILVASADLLAEHGPLADLDDLKRFPTLSMPNWSGHATWQLTDPQGQARTFHHEPRLTYVDFNALRNAALLGVGIALMLEDGCRQDVAEGRLVEVLPDWTTSFGTIYLAFTSKRGMRPSVRALIDFIAAGYRF